jgi:glycosyltransferase involved in cell wall biosynthesis
MLYALMPVRNEADRWLDLTLFDLTQIEIPILVCDDQSTDSTIEVAHRYRNVTVVERPDDVPSFLEYESKFRQWCWNQLPCKEGDWVLCLDADEFLVSVGEGQDHAEGYWLRQYIKALEGLEEQFGFSWPCSFTVREVWDFDENGDALIRTDGWWAANEPIRLVKWFPDATYDDAKMASKAVPNHPNYGSVFHSQDPGPSRLTVLHYGYAKDQDKQAKYERYKAHPAGHNPVHIESILARPTLEPWINETPAKTWRV